MSVHLVGREGLLLDAARQRLYALNSGAALIWSLLKDGKSPDDVGRSLHEEFAVPVDTAHAWVGDILQQYETLAQQPAPADRERAGGAWQGRPRRAAVVAMHALLGSTFRLHFDSHRLFEESQAFLRCDGIAVATATNVTDVVVSADARGVVVVAGDEVIDWSPTMEGGAVAVRAALTQLAIRRSDGLCAVHAGALGRNGRALLLPGDAGHGKSTLSAGLAAQGFDMLSDDTTLLAGEPPLARSIPTGLCVKRGAYAVLEPCYPRLASLPEWRRPDGRHARYLMPGEDLGWAAPDAALPVRWIVFPHYHPGRTTALLPLPRHEALARLLRAAYFVSGPLDGPTVDRFIAWIESIDCFELPLSSLDAGTAMLEELCG